MVIEVENTTFKELCIKSIFNEVGKIANEKNLTVDSYISILKSVITRVNYTKDREFLIFFTRVTNKLNDLYGTDSEAFGDVIIEWIENLRKTN